MASAPRQCSRSCLDYLLLEVVDYYATDKYEAQTQVWEPELAQGSGLRRETGREEGGSCRAAARQRSPRFMVLILVLPGRSMPGIICRRPAQRLRLRHTLSAPAHPSPPPTQEADGGAVLAPAPLPRPLASAALESIGLRVGVSLAERCALGRPPLAAQLDAIKFLCREVWVAAFGKQADNLRTNNRGTFVIRDVQFAWLAALHPNLLQDAAGLEPAAHGDAGPPPAQPATPAELAAARALLPCALVRGALSALGLEASVSMDASGLPQVDFTVVLRQGEAAAQGPGA